MSERGSSLAACGAAIGALIFGVFHSVWAAGKGRELELASPQYRRTIDRICRNAVDAC